jgi:hypothetical protein
VLAGLGAHRGALLAAGGIGEFFTALGRALAEPPASIALAPFHLVVAPTFARSVGQWSTEIGPALAMLAVHAWWVFRTDAAFEDAALEASAERARRIEAMRARRSVAATGAPRAATSTIRLAAGGSPAGAILWKNMLCLKRTAQLRVFVGPVAMSIVIGVATAGGGGGAGPGEVLAVSALALTAMLLIFGGRLIRNDLRHDMQHLPLIKSLPLAPADIVLAEVASAALPMAVGQLVLVVVAYLAISLSGSNPLAANSTFGLLLAAPFALLALNGALLTIQNGTAVLFPGWVRLGPVVSTGVEALGQNLLATVANLLSLAIALIVPALIAWTALSVMRDPHGAAIAAVVVVGAGVLAAETYGAIRFLGNALARAEPAQTA